MKKIICSILLLTLLFCICIASVGCSASNSYYDAFYNLVGNIAVDDETNDLNVTATEVVEYRLSINSDGPVTHGSNYLSRYCEATVYPMDAKDKTVTWSIAWENPSATTEPISNYYELFVETEGSNVVEIRCYGEPAFANNTAILTATTSNGYSVSCKVKYCGVPSNIDFYTTDLSYNSENGCYAYSTDPNEEVMFDVDYTNLFGNVDVNYIGYDYEILSVSGNVKTCAMKSLLLGGELPLEDSFAIVPFSTFLDSNVNESAFDIEVSNYSCRINIDLSDMYSGKRNNDTVRYGAFCEIPEGETCELTIKFTLNADASVYEIVTFRFESSASRVEINNSEIIF